MSLSKEKELPILIKWMEFLKWLLPTTEKFPKRVRFTFADRINNLALDMVEDLIEAQYTRQKRAILQRANLRLEKLRILLRISCEQQYLSYKAYKHAMQAVNEVGRMLGGWIKQQEQNYS
jgi:hypothetical protein